MNSNCILSVVGFAKPMKTIKIEDIMYVYWNERPKDVFLNRTLMEGILEYANKDITKGFLRGILNYKLEHVEYHPRYLERN